MQADAAGVQAVGPHRAEGTTVGRSPSAPPSQLTLPVRVQGGPPSLEELAAAMCRAPGPSQALVVAAAEIQQQLPCLAYVGLAVGAQDRQSVRYHCLHSSRPGAARLGAVPASSCAAGIAIDTKQLVHVRDLANGDLGLLDLQYLQQEHEASCCFVVPLKVAQTALGALSIAATQPHAFHGHEGWLQVVAAMCAPYVLLLKSHEGLLALEGLVSQLLPVRVALQLQDRQRRASQQPVQQDAAQLQPLQPGGTSAATAAAAGAGAEAAGADAGFTASGSSLRQLRGALRLRRQAAQQPTGAAQQQGQPLQPGAQPPSPPQQAQQPSASWLWQPYMSMLFPQPRFEQAFRQWVLRQGLRLLDSLFLLLVLLSAFGTSLRQVFSPAGGLRARLWRWQLPDLQFCTCLGVLLALSVVWVFYCLQRQQASGYLHRRKASLAAVRVLRTLVFCCELWELRPRLGLDSRAATATSRQWTSGHGVLSTATTASCGVLMMLGLLAQLQSPSHAAVQAGCCALVSLMLSAVQLPDAAQWSASVGSAGSSITALLATDWRLPACLWGLGFLFPVYVLAAVERAARRHFLQKLT